MQVIRTVLIGVKYRLKSICGRVERYVYWQPTILNTEESLRLIKHSKLSLVRYGDGEFKLMRGENLGFQKADEKLARRLKEILCCTEKSIAVGIPDVFGNMKQLDSKAARFWYAYMADNRKSLLDELDSKKIYLNSLMTRFWTGYKDKTQVKQIIALYKEIWECRDVVLVEGALTRMGVGNDLFDNAASIHRVLCPAENAWDRYDNILKTIMELNISRDAIFILALGPTATVLAYDLSKAGYQALDLGHLDVQYEYSFRNAVGKIALEGKYVNENIQGREVSDRILNQDYIQSILAKVE